MLPRTAFWAGVACVSIAGACSAQAEDPPFIVADLQTGSAGANPTGLVTYNGALYFAAEDGTSGVELFRCAGPSEAPELVKDCNPAGSSTPQDLTVANGLLFFTADDGTAGRELWVSDGTPSGTRLVTDIHPSAASAPKALAPFGAGIYFSADDGAHGRELWRSDGTEAGTEIVADINPDGGSFAQGLKVYAGKLYFSANDGGTSQELWRTDGTEQGTTLVKDIYVNGHANPSSLTVANGWLLFTAVEPANGQELWRTDGTSAGTQLVRDIRAGGNSFPMLLVPADGGIWFSADDGVNGRELWWSDGTEAGTALVADIAVGGQGSFPQDLAPLADALYFTAATTAAGREIYWSDGSAPGTVLIKDIRSPGSSEPRHLIAANGLVYFQATDAANGQEVWVTDGVESGTNLLHDIYPGVNYSEPDSFHVFGTHLFFAADDGANGRELWAYELPGVDATPPVITILGANPAVVEQGAVYVDAGALATDNADGDLTTSITVSNTVNTTTPGIYEVEYSVSDSSGNSADDTRFVQVAASEPPVITLLGPDPAMIEQDGNYIDAGATAADNVDGNITTEIVATSTVNTAVAGTYGLTYSVSDDAGNDAMTDRQVIVVEAMPPVITLLGANPMALELGGTFIDPGATAVDNVDGNLTANIVVTGAVDTSVPGDYALVYEVSDAAGHAAAPQVRLITVQLPNGPEGTDTDGDGVTDPAEEEVGTDPNDPDDTPYIWDFLSLFEAEGWALYGARGLDYGITDLDGDLLPDRYEIALVAYGLGEPRFEHQTLAQLLWLQNLVTLRGEAAYTGALESYEHVLAAAQVVGADLGAAWSVWEALTETYARYAPLKAISEPFAGDADLDGDGYSNYQEYLNVQAHGGDLLDYIAAATNPNFNGGPLPASKSWALALAVLLIAIIGISTLLTPAVRSLKNDLSKFS